MNEIYIYVIVALLPLTACMVVFQANPYHALIVRGILGAVAAMVYAVLGAADVSLTEALVGTMLAITLYVVAVRSSLVMRLGVLEDKSNEVDNDEDHFGQLIDGLRTILGKHYMHLELMTYTNMKALNRALMDKEVHATCVGAEDVDQDGALHGNRKKTYHTTTRVRRIYDIMQTELSSPATILTYTSTPDSGEEHK